MNELLVCMLLVTRHEVVVVVWGVGDLFADEDKKESDLDNYLTLFPHRTIRNGTQSRRLGTV